MSAIALDLAMASGEIIVAQTIDKWGGCYGMNGLCRRRLESFSLSPHGVPQVLKEPCNEKNNVPFERSPNGSRGLAV